MSVELALRRGGRTPGADGPATQASVKACCSVGPALLLLRAPVQSATFSRDLTHWRSSVGHAFLKSPPLRPEHTPDRSHTPRATLCCFAALRQESALPPPRHSLAKRSLLGSCGRRGECRPRRSSSAQVRAAHGLPLPLQRGPFGACDVRTSRGGGVGASGASGTTGPQHDDGDGRWRTACRANALGAADPGLSRREQGGTCLNAHELTSRPGDRAAQASCTRTHAHAGVSSGGVARGRSVSVRAVIAEPPPAPSRKSPAPAAAASLPSSFALGRRPLPGPIVINGQVLHSLTEERLDVVRDMTDHVKNNVSHARLLVGAWPVAGGDDGRGGGDISMCARRGARRWPRCSSPWRSSGSRTTCCLAPRTPTSSTRCAPRPHCAWLCASTRLGTLGRVRRDLAHFDARAVVRAACRLAARQVRELRQRTDNLPDDYLVVFIGEREPPLAHPCGPPRALLTAPPACDERVCAFCAPLLQAT